MANKIKDELQKLIVEEMNKIAAEKESEFTDRGSQISYLFAFQSRSASRVSFVSPCVHLFIRNANSKR